MTQVLTPTQIAAVQADSSSFLLGPAGTGKSTALRRRLLALLETKEPAYTMLVLVAELEHAQGFIDTLHGADLGSYSELNILTYNQLARQMLTLFWPLVARPAGFDRPYQPPTFLSYDLAQLLMWRVISPMLEAGVFANLPLRPQQIVSQLLDTLNRAALNRLTLEETNQRYIQSWTGDKEHLSHFHDAAAAAHQFRQTCLSRNLLDLSLVVRVFDQQLVQHPEFHTYFSERYRHLIIDNIEEQAPAGQNFVSSLMPTAETTAIAYDSGGGYKRFLAADPASANRFYNQCRRVFQFDLSFSSSSGMIELAQLVENSLMGTQQTTSGTEEMILTTIGGRYRREMVSRLVRELGKRIAEGLPAREIAIIAPYLDGTLRYMLTKELGKAGIPYRLLRRRSLPRDEPRVRAWLIWMALANSNWGVSPSQYDVAEAFSLSIENLDPARAQLLTENIYQPGSRMLPATSLPQKIIERIGREKTERADELGRWLEEHGDDRLDADVFLHQLFNSLLSHRRFRAAPDLSGAAVCDWLVRTAGRLRIAAEPMGLTTRAEIGRAFIDGIEKGMVTANPPDIGDPPDPNGVLISTIYGYLLEGQNVRVQTWLETTASGWWDIPRQPLSNAFVLAQSWSNGQEWTVDEDFKIRNELLSRIIRGLTARCSEGIILANSDLDRRGLRQDGPLWRALQPIAVDLLQA